MAKIIKTNRDLEKEYTMHFKKAKLAFILSNLIILGSFVGIGLLFTDTPRIICIIMIPLCFFIALLFDEISKESHTKATILLNGIYGEKITRKIIEKLPDDYLGFQNIKVTYKGETSEIDMVVVGPNGVFVIETKHLNGHIKGYSGKTWAQEKVGRRGRVYTNNFYSPIKQAGTHIYHLANYLRDHGGDVYVVGAVYFSNPETTYEGIKTQNDITVICSKHNGEQALTDYILTMPRCLGKENRALIHQLLIKCAFEK